MCVHAQKLLCCYQTTRTLLVSFGLVAPHSYSLEGLAGGQAELRGHAAQGPGTLESSRLPQRDRDDRGSLVSLTEEREELAEHRSLQDLVRTCTHARTHAPSLSSSSCLPHVSWLVLLRVPSRR